MAHRHSSCWPSAQAPTFAGSPCDPILPEHMEGPGLNQASHALKCSIALHRGRPQCRLCLHGGQRFTLKDRLCWAALALYGRACTAQDTGVKAVQGVLASPSPCAALHVGQQTGLKSDCKLLLASVQVGPSAGGGCTMPSAAVHQQATCVRLGHL